MEQSKESFCHCGKISALLYQTCRIDIPPGMLTVWILALSLGFVSAGDWSYPERTSNGWDGVCESGNNQSPIDLNTTMTATIHAPLQLRNYGNKMFNKNIKGTLRNDGTTVSWYANPTTTTHMRGGGQYKAKTPSVRDGPFGGNVYSHAYYLWKLEFHWGTPGNTKKGSEHTVDGNAYPLEMQMIHIEDEFISVTGRIKFVKAFKSPLGVAILSVFFRVDDRKPQNQEPLTNVDSAILKYMGKRQEELTESEVDGLDQDEIDEVDHDMNMRMLKYGFDQLKESEDSDVKERRSSHQPEKIVRLWLNVGAFIRKATNKGKGGKLATYWTYNGSFTTPDCAEAVTWVVFERSLPIAQVQANAFGTLYRNNFRKPKTVTHYHDVLYLIHGKQAVQQ